MKRSFGLLLGLGGVALAIFFFIQSKRFDQTDHERFNATLRRLQHLDTTFNEETLKARFDILAHYDDFAVYQADIERAVAVLENVPAFVSREEREQIAGALAEYRSLGKQRSEKFESFKSQNAVLKNSLRYFPTASGELVSRIAGQPENRELELDLNELMREVLTYGLNADLQSAAAEQTLARLKDWKAQHRDHREALLLSSLLAHAQSILNRKPKVDALTREIVSLPMTQKIEGVFQVYEKQLTEAMARSYRARTILYALCGALILGIAYALYALRAANRHLEARVQARTTELSRTNESLRGEISERQRAEEERDRFFTLSLELMCIGGLDGSFKRFNPAFTRVLGWSDAELTSKTFVGLVHPDDRAATQAQLDALASGQSIKDFESRCPCRDGSVRWLSWIAVPVTEKNLFYAYGHDVTARKAAEAELAVTHKKLLETSRLAGMSEVASGVLHNVGNVLNSVNVSATLLGEKIKKSKAANVGKVASLLRGHENDLANFLTADPKGKQVPAFLSQLAEHLAAEQKDVLEETENLRKHISYIKDVVAMQQGYARQTGIKETLQVSELIEDTLRLNAGSLSRHDIQVVREIGAVPAVLVEKHKALQILVNLVRNAKQACDESGKNEKIVKLRVTNGDEKVRISVIDNGIGIPAENLKRLFHHGFTTKKDGHGFGLHSSALAAKETGGALTVESDGPGTGATFTLELPVAA